LQGLPTTQDAGRKVIAPLKPILGRHVLQNVGMDTMGLPNTSNSSHYVCSGFPGFPIKVTNGISRCRSKGVGQIVSTMQMLTAPWGKPE